MNARQITAVGERTTLRSLERLADTGLALQTALRSTHVLLAPKLAFHLERLAIAEWDRREALVNGNEALAERFAARREKARTQALAYMLKTN